MRIHHQQGDQSGPRARLGAAALGAGLTAALLCLAAACGMHAVTAGRGAVSRTVEVSEGVEVLAAAAAGLVAAWLAVLLLLGTVAALPGSGLAGARAAAAVLAPRATPRIAAALVAVAAVIAPVGSAHAHQASTMPARVASVAAPAPGEGQSVGERSRGSAGTAQPRTPTSPRTDTVAVSGTEGGVPDPGWLPTRSGQIPDSASIDLVARGSAAPDSVVVRAGDTLWDIAAAQLGHEADPATIAATWPLWYDANRETIGADPDLILPGTRLLPPSQSSAGSATQGAREQVAP